MHKNPILTAVAPILMLGACGRAQGPADETVPGPAANVAAAAASAPGAVPGNGADAELPVATPAVPPPHAERGVEGARHLLRSFAHAIERKAYGDAWAMLSPGDRQRWSRAAFAALFAELEGIAVAVGDGTREGAAGSSFYTAPVIITGRDRQGRPIRFEGEAVLRRVNDVPGVTPAQLSWRFERLRLDWTH